MHLFAALARRATTTPDAVFCHLPTRAGVTERVTAGAIMREARHLAGQLRAQGVQPGQIVPIILEHRRELYSSFIACTLLGAAPAFLPPLTRKQDPAAFAHAMRALMDRIAPHCVIVSATTRPGFPHSPCVDVDAPAPAEPLAPLIPAAASEEIAFLQHSSGTTGHKKGVCLTHRTVLAQITAYGHSIGAVEGEVIASWLPLYHDMGLITCFLLPAVLGLPIVSIDALEWVMQPAMLLDAVATHRAGLCWLPNFAFHHIIRMVEPARQWDLSSLRVVVNCSEPCRAPTFDAFATRFTPSQLRAEALQTSYAMAENVFAVTQSTIGQTVRRGTGAAAGFLSSGPSLPGTELRVLAPPGEIGDIEIRGDSLFAGYHAMPDLTASRMRDGWYRTGDLGVLQDGELFVIGRADDVLNINGKKLIAHEIEDALNTLPGLAPGRILVFAKHDDAEGASHLVVAAEPLETDNPALPAAIRRAVAENCGLRPHRVMLLARGFLLKSTSGKISRQASIDKLAGLPETTA